MNIKGLIQRLRGSLVFIIITAFILYVFSFFGAPGVFIVSTYDDESVQTEEFLNLINRLNEIAPDVSSGNPFDVEFLNSINSVEYVDYYVEVRSVDPGRVNPFSLTSTRVQIDEDIDAPDRTPEEEEAFSDG